MSIRKKAIVGTAAATALLTCGLTDSAESHAPPRAGILARVDAANGWSRTPPWLRVIDRASHGGLTFDAVTSPELRRLVDPAPVAGVGQAPAHTKRGGPRYHLIDIGTLGGPHAELDGPAVQITRDGGVLGAADTTIPDADFPNDGPAGGNPFIEHAVEWHHGHLTDLGALPGNNSSFVFEVNGDHVGAGASETESIDPLTAAPAQHAVLFRHGHVHDLGTLPGGTESFAIAINDHGTVAGLSNNSVPDPGFSNFFDWHTQVRTFVWHDGVMRDIGTLGGPDAEGALLNRRGQVAGDSYINDQPDPYSGVPDQDAYLWTKGRMRDLGGLGGAITRTNWLSNSGAVVGAGTTAGNAEFHPFLWDRNRMHDLGTLGGTIGVAEFVDDRGDVVGFASTPGDETFHAFLWHAGHMRDLTKGASPGCTTAYSVNDHGQAVGETCDSSEALLYENGRQYDLTSLVGRTDVQLTEIGYIDNQGRITALGTLPNGTQHVFLLRPTSGHGE